MLNRKLSGPGFCPSFGVAVLALVLGVPSAHAAPSANAFNPKISLILQGAYANYSRDDAATMPGVVLGPETELRPQGFALGESELAIEANVDHLFRGWMTVAFEQEENETVVAVEEAYLETLAMPQGFALKFGRFLSAAGYLNKVHSHAWDFADTPLAYRAFLANQLRDDGLQLRWLAPTDFFLELGAEGLRGAAYPGGAEQSGGIGAWTAFAHVGADVGAGGSWQASISYLDFQADNSEVGEDLPASFSGDSQLWIADVVYKWAPNGNATQRNLVIQAEYLQRKQSGVWVDDPEGAANSSDYAGRQSGWYLQAAYQFMPMWRVGLRYDQVETDNRVLNPMSGTVLENLANAADDSAKRISLMMDWSPSEFSRLRVQYNRDASRPAAARDDQILLQYIYSLGAHPAHQF